MGVQVLGLPAAERFPTLLAVSDFDAASLVMATSSGGIKRTPLTAFSKIRGSGLAAIKLHEVGTNAQACSGGVFVVVYQLTCKSTKHSSRSVRSVRASRPHGVVLVPMHRQACGSPPRRLSSCAGVCADRLCYDRVFCRPAAVFAG